jgi:D-lactate dehydrogenase
MRAAIFSTRPFDRQFLDEANHHRHQIVYFETGLNESTAGLAAGFPIVVPFVNDRLNPATLRALHATGTRALALRSAGFNHVDIDTADALGITVMRVPAYSPHAVAEHTVGLMLTLCRKIHRAYNRVREQNFALDGLLGFDLCGKTVGIVGTGKIGAVVAAIMRGFGCRVLVADPVRSATVEALGAVYAPFDALLAESDILTLHCPLTPATRHMINADVLGRMKRGAMLINTSRGGLIDTPAVIEALKSARLGSLGLDVYEEEGDLFFRDLSERVIADDVFSRLLTFPNVVVTAHQAFFTKEAVTNIATTTIKNITDFEAGTPDPANIVTSRHIAR